MIEQERSNLETVKATARQVVWPYSVYERDKEGEIITDPVTEEPCVNPPATWTARALSTIAGIAAVILALEEAGVPVRRIIASLFSD